MANKSHYLVQWVPEIQQDLSQLPLELQKNWTEYQKILAIAPYQLFGLNSHNLTGKLKGYRAIEIDFQEKAYRLVYKIYDKPTPKRVVVLSFAEHDRLFGRWYAKSTDKIPRKQTSIHEIFKIPKAITSPFY